MQRLALTGLLKIELPARTIRFTDGGFKVWNGETYLARDALFGVIVSAESMEEGVGDEVPAFEMQLAPPGTAVVADLSQPGYQRARVRSWIAEYDIATNAIIGSPSMEFDGQIDQTSLSIGRLLRVLQVSVVSSAEKLFARNLGNSMSDAFHQQNNPGELGHANATGLKVPIAWGVAAPRGASSGGGGGGGDPRNSGQNFYER